MAEAKVVGGMDLRSVLVDVFVAGLAYGALLYVGTGQLGILGIQDRYGGVSALKLVSLSCIYGGFVAFAFGMGKRVCLRLCAGALLYLGQVAFKEWNAWMLLPLAAYALSMLWTALAWLDERAS